MSISEGDVAHGAQHIILIKTENTWWMKPSYRNIYLFTLLNIVRACYPDLI